MSRIIDALRRYADGVPDKPAIQDENGTLTYRQLLAAVERAAEELSRSSASVVALHADNGVAWVVADLACLMLKIPTVPLPAFFSSAQCVHVLLSAGVDYVLTDQPERLAALQLRDVGPASPFFAELVGVVIRNDLASKRLLPDGTQKITFTSGTTGEPKGVCLGIDEMESTASSLCLASEGSSDDRHMCTLPLATLLENIGGVFAPLLAGATICVPRLASVGLTGSSTFAVDLYVSALRRFKATSAILVPQMLQALIGAGLRGAPMPETLRYLAVGGAPVSSRMLDAASALGLPVYEGYGLSECASVVALNRPGANRRGSVGLPLPHVRIDFAEDGEILVQGVCWRGYLGHPPAQHIGQKFFATGDLGYLDAGGFLYLTGRKKNIFITSFGRNVAPEWVESELVSHPPILQAAVFGEGRPFNTAVVFALPNTPHERVAEAVATANRDLPDYAWIRAWVRATEPFCLANGLSTANGRLRREAIFTAYATQIGAAYRSPQEVALT